MYGAASRRERLSWTLLLPGVITDFMNNPQRQANDSVEPWRFAIGYANMMPKRRREADRGPSASIFTNGLRAEASRAYLLAHGCSGPRRSAVACANDPRR